MSIANDFGLLLIEDAAESIGSTYKEKHTGTFGLMGALSFNGNKTITSGGGGAILVSDEDIAIRAKHITRTARIDHRWEYNHDEIGYNFRMPNINAALGLAQLEQLQGKLMRKRKLFEKYYEVFSSIEGITLFKEPENCTSNYWLQAIILNELNENLRDTILEVTNDVGITTRPSWRLLTNLTPYRYHPRMELTVASSLASRIINIPSSPNLIVD
jgi:dTDP-4-amino-4,6-dideoxygalactose transaminase